jgi:hypothetical protein
MQLTMEAAPVSKANLWIGRAIGGFAVLFLLFDAVIKPMKIGPVQEAFAHLGLPIHLALAIGLLELACTVLYVIPRTAVLGAVLLTGFLGGATAIHVRVGDPFFFPSIIGAMIWAGLYLTDSRLRALFPLRGS